MFFFSVFLGKILAFDVSADSLCLFFVFFALVFFILVFLYLLYFLPIKINFSGGFYMNVHLLLMFLPILFISFTVSLLHVLDIVASMFVTFFCTIKMIFWGFFYENS